jgi:2Fe-2S ferredoxin
MPKVTFINPDESRITIDVPIGESLMRAATSNGIDTILGTCGGALACATCHIFVDPEHRAQLPEMSDDENEMLEYAAAGRQEGSRLSCQIVMTDELAGIMVRVADPQI